MRARGPTLAGLIVLLAGCGSAGGSAGGTGLVAPAPVRANVPRAEPTVARADATALRDGNALFAGRILARLASTHSNMALSPASISQALAMVFPGARGTTASQIAGALDFRLPPDRLGAAFNAADRSLANINGPNVTLDVANALFGQSGQRFHQAFLRVLARDYGAGLRTADFERDPAGARSDINAWVSEQTRGKIPELLGPDDVDPLTRLVLVNAVHLKAKWLEPFAHEDTSRAAFDAPGGTVEVPTMHQTGMFGYLQGLDYQALELRYKGGRLAFDVVLPSPGRLGSVLSRLAGEGPPALLDGLRQTQVAVALPKFRLTTHIELASPLQALGMRLAFQPGRADLSAVADKPGDLYVNAVVHEAHLDVDEAGTEAAAATGVGVVGTAVPAPPKISFIADRPFAFVLRDVKTGAVLFAGVVSRP